MLSSSTVSLYVRIKPKLITVAYPSLQSMVPIDLSYLIPYHSTSYNPSPYFFQATVASFWSLNPPIFKDFYLEIPIMRNALPLCYHMVYFCCSINQKLRLISPRRPCTHTSLCFYHFVFYIALSLPVNLIIDIFCLLLVFIHYNIISMKLVFLYLLFCAEPSAPSKLPGINK